MNEKQKEMTAAEMAKGDVAANDDHGLKYPANKVQEGLRRLIAEDKIDEEGADLIFWLYSYIQENNLSYNGAADMTGMSSTVIYHLVHADYKAKYDSVLEKIEKFKEIVEERAKSKSLGFVETSAAKDVFNVCKSALYDGMPAFIYGASQTGKTTALLEFQRTHNHGTTKYIRLGVRWTKRRVVRALARACKCFSEDESSCVLEDRILTTLTNRMLLIVDEFHLALETTTDLAAKEIVEYFREIYDRTGVGLVICGTKVAEAGLESGKNHLLFDQMRRRGLVKLVLPDVPKKADVNKIAKEFGLDAPTGDTYAGIQQILRRFGLGMFVKYLQKSDALAKADKRVLTWDDFAGVANGYAALSQPKNEY